MVRKNWWHMLKVSRFQSVFTVCIIAFLLFFLQILAVMSFKISQSTQEVQQKLGVYFYLVEDTGNKDEVYADAIDFMNDLERAGLRVEFFSKEQAFQVLANRLPNVLDNLEKFGIENPLPPTMYVMFRNQQEYELLKSTATSYEHILDNLDDVTGGMTFGEQEARVSTVINMMHALKVGSFVLIGIVVVIIVAFLRYAIKINFLRFQQQIEVEKLLGATYRQIVSPFLLHVSIVLLCAFMLMGTIVFVTLSYLNPYFVQVYGLTVYQTLLPTTTLLMQFTAAQVAGVYLTSSLFAGSALYGLLKRV